MKKIFLIFLILIMNNFSYAVTDNLSGRPDIRPLKDKDIVSIVRGFVLNLHNGIDFSCRVDSEIRATGAGEIIIARYVNGYGNLVVIKHDWVQDKKAHTAYSFYGHLVEFKKVKGDKVKRGDLIALSGSTGKSDGPHLHYELRNENFTPIWNGTFQAEKTREEKLNAQQTNKH